MKDKKTLILVVVALIIVLAIYSFPNEIKKEFTGLKYRLDDASEEKRVAIKIDGWYTRRLFQNDQFQGTIYIGDEKLSQVNSYVDKEGEILVTFDDESEDFKSFGKIYSLDRFKEFTIAIFENGEWDNEEGIILSAPAKDREDAVKISKSLMESLITN
ncbi:hypothetical protein PRVXT_002287 [Proteinivorax tanatarense]|uniref:Uncharacterized protein n=1 Tax=Proteinivorax tanatarense TaxID=1260629 RepID=A0AAU7VJU5_9FIRM